MRSLGGLVLLGGLGVGLFLYMPAPVSRDTSLDTARQSLVTSVAKTPRRSVTQAPRARSFSPSVELAAFTRRERPATRTAKAETPAPPPSAAAGVSVHSGWQAVVAVSGAPAQVSLQPTDAAGRYKLIIDIQQRLRQLGCYYGRIDGSWGAGTKHAMAAFTARVNAALPIEQPDYVLLSLLQAHGGKSCGECPAGSALSADGRCLPHSVVAHSQRGPASGTQEVLPWKAAQSTQPLFKPVASSVVSTEPLPGRMAIGAPKVLPPVQTGAEQPVAESVGTGGQAVAALEPEREARPPQRETSSATPRRRSSGSGYKRSRRGDGPGTPRYNLLLSLGGIY